MALSLGFPGTCCPEFVEETGPGEGLKSFAWWAISNFLDFSRKFSCKTKILLLYFVQVNGGQRLAFFRQESGLFAI